MRQAGEAVQRAPGVAVECGLATHSRHTFQNTLQCNTAAPLHCNAMHCTPPAPHQPHTAPEVGPVTLPGRCAARLIRNWRSSANRQAASRASSYAASEGKQGGGDTHHRIVRGPHGAHTYQVPRPRRSAAARPHPATGKLTRTRLLRLPPPSRLRSRPFATSKKT